MMRFHPHGVPQVPTPLARRMAALGLDLVRVARDDPGLFADLKKRCTQCQCIDRCARDLQCDPAGPMRYCPNHSPLNFLTEMWWLRTLL